MSRHFLPSNTILNKFHLGVSQFMDEVKGYEKWEGKKVLHIQRDKDPILGDGVSITTEEITRTEEQIRNMGSLD